MSSDIWAGVGRAGQDATSRFTSEGVQVTSFSLAVDRGYGDNKKTQWIRVSCWRKLAEIAAQYVTKGKLLWCEGEIGTHCYQAKNGEWVASLDLNARNVRFLGGKSDAQQQGADDMGVTEIDDLSDVPF